jgi:hypothetical protein
MLDRLQSIPTITIATLQILKLIKYKYNQFKKIFLIQSSINILFLIKSSINIKIVRLTLYKYQQFKIYLIH